MGRLLITFLLTEREILHKPVLYLSHYFKQHRQTYYEHLQAVRDQGAWEAWLAFFLRGVIEVAGEAAETARRILQLREQHRAAITAQLGRAAGNCRVPDDCLMVSRGGLMLARAWLKEFTQCA